jgi:hypothetical protein
MNIREDILRLKDGIPRYTIDEMAAKELNAVMDLIMAGKPEEAARKYFEFGGNRRGITRTVNTFLNKNPDADKEKILAFRAATSQAADEMGIKTDYKKKTSAKTREGEEVAAGAQSGESRRKTAIKRIEKEGMLSKKELDRLDSEKKKRLNKRLSKEHAKLEQQLVDIDSDDENKLRDLAKEILDDISEPPLNNQEKRDVKILSDYVEKGEKEDIAIDIMRDVIEAGLSNLDAIYQHLGRGSSINPSEKIAKKKESQYRKIEKLKKEKEK